MVQLLIPLALSMPTLPPRGIVGSESDTGHKALMPGVTPRLTGHNARNAPGILDDEVALRW